MKVAISLLLLLALPVLAEDFYVKQIATGGEMTSCALATNLAWLRDSSNWGVGAGKVSAGDTVHFCGTFTNDAMFLGSGTAGNPITFLFETGAKFSWPAWPSGALGEIRATNRSYIVVDGGTDGLIETTDNGTALTYQRANDGVVFWECSFATVKNLKVGPLYQRTDLADLFASAVGIRNSALATPANPWSDFTVTNCLVWNCFYGIYATYHSPGASNVIFSGNVVTNCNWGFGQGDSGAGVMRHSRIYGNTVSNWSTWSGTGAAAATHHNNGYYGYAENTGTLEDTEVYGNVFGPGYGTSQTGGIFTSGNVKTFRAYNNLFIGGGAGDPSPGFIVIEPYNSADFVGLIANNTIVGAGNAIGIMFEPEIGQATASITFRILNNLIYDTATAIALFRISGGETREVDYNMGYSLTPGSEYSASTTVGANFETLTQWQQVHGFDVHGGTNQNPLLNVDYSIPANSPAVGAGTDLTAYFTTDFYGRTRSVPFDAGEFEYVPTAPPALTISGAFRASGSFRISR